MTPLDIPRVSPPMPKKKTTNKTLNRTTEIPVLFAIPARTPPNKPLLLLFMRINIDLNNFLPF